MKNEMNEIPTPETAAFMLEYNRALAAMKTRPSLWDKMESLERRLTLEKNRAEEMGKLAHKNACEAMECRRLLTVARGVLEDLEAAGVEGGVKDDDHHMIKIREALTITAPKP